jgi:hypothetical protein
MIDIIDEYNEILEYKYADSFTRKKMLLIEQLGAIQSTESSNPFRAIVQKMGKLFAGR